MLHQVLYHLLEHFQQLILQTDRISANFFGESFKRFPVHIQHKRDIRNMRQFNQGCKPNNDAIYIYTGMYKHMSESMSKIEQHLFTSHSDSDHLRHEETQSVHKQLPEMIFLFFLLVCY